MKISPKATNLDAKFWTNFSKKHWQKKAHVWRNLNSGLSRINAEEIFQMLVQYANLCRKRKSSRGFKLFIEGELQYDQDTLQFLPEKKDQSLGGYHQRMEKIFPDYCLVCDELLQVSASTWENLTSITSSLYCEIGFPHRFSELGLYLGNYKTTPFGVHVDGCGVFSFPVVGEKKFRIWSPAFVDKHPELDRSHDYKRFKKDSLLLSVKPGDMSYWPSQDWHIAESDGSFSATWSLGVWVDRPLEELVQETLSSLLRNKLNAVLSSGTTFSQTLVESSGEVSSLPDSILQVIESLRALSGEELKNEFAKTWLKLLSRQGLKNFPVMPELSDKNSAGKKMRIWKKTDQVKLRYPGSLVWKATAGEKGQFIFSFDSKSALCQASPKMIQWIASLNRGQVCELNEILKNSRDRKLMEELHSWDALILLNKSENIQKN